MGFQCCLCVFQQNWCKKLKFVTLSGELELVQRAYSNLCGSKIAQYSGGLSGGWSQSDCLIYLVFLKVFKNCWLLLVLWITIKGKEEVLPFCKNKDPNVLSNIIIYLLNGGKLPGKTSEDHLWGPLTQLQQQLSMFSSTRFEIVKFVLS